MDDVLEVGQVLEADQAGVQPLVVGLLGGEPALDLLVLDDASLVEVEQEHAPRLEPALAGHGGGVEVQHAGLRREHDETVVGDPVAAGAQTVAVQDRADLGAVGEAHARGAVPRLHHVGVELIEGPTRGIHLGVVLPRLGDHHHDRVRQLAAAEVQQLEDLVEGRGVRALGVDDREQAVEVAGDEVALEGGLAGTHPVAVAAGGVDLAVVRDEAERVRERPARERVGGEAAVHDRQRRLHALVAQVGEELVELLGGEHALVDEGARRQAREVDLRLVLGALAQAVGETVELDARAGLARRGDEHQRERRHRAARHGAENVGVDGHVAPREDLQALLGGERLDVGAGLRGLVGLDGQERHARGVRTGLGQLHPGRLLGHGPQEAVGHLHQHARTVAGVGLAADGATVVEVAQRGQTVLDDLVAGRARQGGDERDTAGVVLVARVVQALRGRLGREMHRNPSASSVDVVTERRSAPLGRRWPKQSQATPGIDVGRASGWVDRARRGLRVGGGPSGGGPVVVRRRVAQVRGRGFDTRRRRSFLPRRRYSTTEARASRPDSARGLATARHHRGLGLLGLATGARSTRRALAPAVPRHEARRRPPARGGCASSPTRTSPHRPRTR